MMRLTSERERCARERAEIRHIRHSLEAALDRIIAVPDQLDPDTDLEADGSDELSLQLMLRGGVDALAA